MYFLNIYFINLYFINIYNIIIKYFITIKIVLKIILNLYFKNKMY